MDPTTAVGELLKHGILGVLLCLALWWIYKLHNQNVKMQSEHVQTLKEIQDKRTDDAKLVVDKLLLINDKWNNAVSEHVRVIEQMDPVLREIKTLLMSERTGRR